jgi:hypothetical protein
MWEGCLRYTAENGFKRTRSITVQMYPAAAFLCRAPRFRMLYAARVGRAICPSWRKGPLLPAAHASRRMANSKYEYVKGYELPDPLLPGCWVVVRVDGKGFTK